MFRCSSPPMVMTARRLLVPHSRNAGSAFGGVKTIVRINSTISGLTTSHYQSLSTPTLPLLRTLTTTIPRASPPPPPPPHALTQSTADSSSNSQIDTTTSPIITAAKKQLPKLRPLSSLPLTDLLRSILLHTVSSVPILLTLSTRLLSRDIPYIDSPWHPLHWLLYPTFYKHFCAGRNEAEILSVSNKLRNLGIEGLILSYAREVDVHGTQSSSTRESELEQLSQWTSATLKTISYSPAHSYTAIKLSGIGPLALRLLTADPPLPPTPEMKAALDQICNLARERDVGLLVDAEHSREQPGIDMWTRGLMRAHNNRGDGKCVVYNTYQMYLKSSPATLRADVELAGREGWVLGAKVVRGAYLSSEPRGLICDTKEDTDRQYDEAVEYLFSQREVAVGLVVACHNRESVRLAREFAGRYGVGGRRRKDVGGEAEKVVGVTEVVYSQLMGMADELSFGLVEEGRAMDAEAEGRGEKPRVYKYVVWGSVGECLKYLLRRAQENQAAVGRSRENVRACWEEVRCRMGLN